jgi:hypothetical protein
MKKYKYQPGMGLVLGATLATALFMQCDRGGEVESTSSALLPALAAGLPDDAGDWDSQLLDASCAGYINGNISQNKITVREVQGNQNRFPQWKRHGVGFSDRSDTYIAVQSQPCRQNVEHVAVFIAGQQGLFGDIGSKPNGLTGQPDSWGPCGNSCTRTLNSQSLFLRIYRSGRMPASKTLFALVFDSDFNYGASEKDKNRKENAFYDWIRDNVQSSNLKTIYLAGSSRGGALTSRLAKRFKNDTSYRNIPLILQNLDGTHRPGHDMGVPGNFQKSNNPLNANYQGIIADLHTQFSYRSKLAIYQIVGGEKFKLDSVHGYTYRARECRLYEHCNLGWYRQSWVNLTHEQIGRDTHRPHFTDAYNFFLEKFALFQAGGSSSTGVGTVSSSSTGGGGTGGTGNCGAGEPLRIAPATEPARIEPIDCDRLMAR